MINMANFPKASKYWYMGKFYDWSKLTIHPMSHGLHYGTIVFEGIRAYPTSRGAAVFRLGEHTDRFFYSAGVAKMVPPYDAAKVNDVIKQVVRENKLASCYIRPLLFYSYGNLGLVPKASPVEFLCSAWEWGAYLGENAGAGTSVYILPTRRIHHAQVDMKAKLGGLYMLSTIGGLEARANPFHVVPHPLLDELQWIAGRDLIDGLDSQRHQVLVDAAAPGEVGDPARRHVLNAVLPEGALVGGKAVVVRLDGRRYRGGQDLSHRGKTPGDLGLAIDHLASQVLFVEELLEVEWTARVEVPRVEVHQRGSVHSQAGPFEHVGLDG